MIGAFCDLALALNGDFERYAATVFEILQAAQSQNAGPGADEDLVEYIEKLHLSILEAYTGILAVCRCDFPPHTRMST